MHFYLWFSVLVTLAGNCSTLVWLGYLVWCPKALTLLCLSYQ